MVTTAKLPITSRQQLYRSATKNTLIAVNSSKNSRSTDSRKPILGGSIRLAGKSIHLQMPAKRSTNNSSDILPLTGATAVKEDTGDEIERQVMTYKQGRVERRVGRNVLRYRPRPPRKVKYSHGSWQTADVDGKVYLYSAYYDARPNLDWPQVRIIAVAEYGQDISKLCCLLWYRVQRLPDVAEISAVEVGSEYLQPVLGQYIFSCRVDKNKKHPPISVSVVVGTSYNFRLSNLLPVKVPEQQEQIIEFGLCVAVLYRNPNLYWTVEWLESHRIWGVREVSVYARNIDDSAAKVLRWYAATGFVSYHELAGELTEDSIIAERLSKFTAVNDCMYRNLYRYRYVVCPNLYEMVLPSTPHLGYSEMLAAADAATTRPNHAIVHSYSFQNIRIFVDFATTENGSWSLMTERHVHVRCGNYCLWQYISFFYNFTIILF